MPPPAVAPRAPVDRGSCVPSLRSGRRARGGPPPPLRARTWNAFAPRSCGRARPSARPGPPSESDGASLRSRAVLGAGRAMTRRPRAPTPARRAGGRSGGSAPPPGDRGRRAARERPPARGSRTLAPTAPGRRVEAPAGGRARRARPVGTDRCLRRRSASARPPASRLSRAARRARIRRPRPRD